MNLQNDNDTHNQTSKDIIISSSADLNPTSGETSEEYSMDNDDEESGKTMTEKEPVDDEEAEYIVRCLKKG